ncbi:MAG: hypothetical protein M5U01_13185 [Ardenticatenaceae bacterium]|nr:hypothetical protein [Ardenticatenaceae bacterium]HBY96362.1 hypothetical protein [Chloroflexota bacterium]
MNRSLRRRWTRWVRCALTLALLLLALAIWGGSRPSWAEPAAPSTVTVPGHYELDLPLVARNYWVGTLPDSNWGVQFFYFQERDRPGEVMGIEAPRSRSLGMATMRLVVEWRNIERTNTVPATYDWSYYDTLVQGYQNLGFDVIIEITGYPRFATRYYCGGGFVEGGQAKWREFIHAAAIHYASPPFNLRLFELGNEPDHTLDLSPDDYERAPEDGGGEPTFPQVSCWGPIPEQYLEFLRIGYREIKAVAPKSTILLGSMGLDQRDVVFIGSFLPRLLDLGGGKYFDVLGYHWYPISWEWSSADQKARWLLDLLQSHDLTKPLWLTESYQESWPPERGSERRQIDFVLKEMVRTLGTGRTRRVFWFAFWDVPLGLASIQRGLVNADHTPKPAVRAVELASAMTYGYPTDLSTDTIELYRFARPWQHDVVFAAWSRDRITQTITLPGPAPFPAKITRLEAGTSYSNTVAAESMLVPNDGSYQLEVDFDPVFVAAPVP